MSDIFISYASEDRAETKKLAQALESLGWSVWWDRSIPIGQSYENVIEEALDEAQCVISIWSKISVKSEWVRAEVAEAQRQGKLFPLNIDGSKPPLVYRALQTAYFSSWSGETSSAVFKQLVDAIQGQIGIPVSKVEPGPEIKEETTHASDESSQTVLPESPDTPDVKRNDGIDTSDIKIGSKSVEGRNDTGVPVVKVEHNAQIKEKTTKPRKPPSQPTPTKALETTKTQKTDTHSRGSGNITMTSATVSGSEQSDPGVKRQKKPKWVAPVIAVLLLSLLIGGVLLFEPKNRETDLSDDIYTQKTVDDGYEVAPTIHTKNPPVVTNAIVSPATKETVHIIEPAMEAIPKGCFQMGSPESDKDRDTDERLHKVCLDAFRMGQYEISFEEYDQYCDLTGCKKSDDKGWGRGSLPVVYVSWENAAAYAACSGGNVNNAAFASALINEYNNDGSTNTVQVNRPPS